MPNLSKAAKDNEELARMEAELMAGVSEEVEEEPEVQSEEDKPDETESAPVEEESPSDTDLEAEPEANDLDEEPLTDEEMERLSNKTKRDMLKLRERAKKAEELEAEVERLKSRNEIRKPLQEVEGVLKEEPKAVFPWDNVPQDPRVVAREEIEKEKKLSYVSADAEYAETYPELNPDRPEYDKELAEQIYSDFKDLFLANNNYRLKDIVDRRMKPIYKARENAVKTAKVEKQKAEEALPTNVTAPKKTVTASDMVKRATSIEELEKLEGQIGVSHRYK